MATLLDGDLEQQGSLQLSSPEFDDGGRLPDYTGYANENECPPLNISGVPDEAESLVLVFDDPDAEPVAGHTWDHWLVWDIPGEVREIPRDWSADDATEGYNDYMEQGYGGPSPPDGTHVYRFKLVALDGELGAAEPTRKQRLGSAIAMGAEVVGATQLEAEYDASQGTAF